jgi:hypothetical protein
MSAYFTNKCLFLYPRDGPNGSFIFEREDNDATAVSGGVQKEAPAGGVAREELNHRQRSDQRETNSRTRTRRTDHMDSSLNG